MEKDEFVERVSRCEKSMYRAALAILGSQSDACDAAQETVARAFVKKAQLRNEEYFETWIMSILINECRSMLRRRKWFSNEEPREIAQEQEPWLHIDVMDALAKLPDKYRIPIVLHYYDGFNLEDISRITDTPRLLVKSRLHQARASLKGILGGDYLED